MDGQGNIIFGQSHTDPTFFTSGVSTEAYLACYSYQGIPQWVKQYESTLSFGQFDGAKLKVVDFSPNGELIGTVFSIEELSQPSEPLGAYAIINATNGEVIFSLSDNRDYSEQTFIYSSSKILVMQDNFDLYLFHEDTQMDTSSREFTIGKISPPEKKLTLYIFQNSLILVFNTFRPTKMQVAEGPDAIYVGVSIANSLSQYFIGVGKFDILTQSYTGFAFNEQLSANVKKGRIKGFAVFHDGGTDYIGGCHARTGNNAGLFLAPFDDYLLGTLTMYQLTTAASSYQCFGLNVFSNTELATITEEGDTIYVLFFDFTTPTSAVRKRIGDFNSADSSIDTGYVFSQSDFYIAGRTNMIEYGGSFSKTQAFVMKLGQERSCLTITEVEDTVSVAPYSATWFTLVSSEKLLTSSQLSLIGDEIYSLDLENYGTLNKVCQEEANIEFPTLSDMSYTIGEAELVQFFDGFSYQGSELTMYYSGSLVSSTDPLPDFIYFSEFEKYISIYTTEPIFEGIYEFYLTGSLYTNEYVQVKFSVSVNSETLIADQEILMFSPVEFSPPLEDIMVTAKTNFDYPLPSLIRMYTESWNIRVLGLPRFASFSNSSFQFRPFEQSDAGVYTIQVMVQESNGTNTVQTSFYFTLTVVQKEEKPPAFSTDPEKLIIVTQGDSLLQVLPPVISEHPTSLSIQKQNSSEGLISLQDNKKLLINSTGIALGRYKLEIIIKDLHTQLSSKNYTIKVQIVERKMENQNATENTTGQKNQTEAEDHTILKTNPNCSMIARIESISEQGIVIVEFSQHLRGGLQTISKLTQIGTYQITEDYQLAVLNHQARVQRVFQNLLFIELSIEKPTSIVYWEGEEFWLSLQFTEPEEIKSTTDQCLSQDYSLLKVMIPNQLGNDQATKMLIENSSALQIVFQSIPAVAILSSIALSTSIGLIWPWLNALQLLVVLPLICERMPENAVHFFKVLTPIAILDFLHLTWLTEALFNFEEGGYNQLFEEFGYEYMQVVLNLRSVFYYILAVLLLFVFISIVSFLSRSLTLARKVDIYLRQNFYTWFLNEIYLLLALSSGVNIYDLHWEQFRFIFNNIFLLGSILAVHFYPLVIVIVIVKAQRAEKGIGAMFKALKDSSVTTLLTSLIFVLQRYFFVIVCLMMGKGFQIHLFHTMQMLKTAQLLHSWPYEDQSRNWQQVFNEATILLSSVLLFMFQGLIQDGPTIYNTGWILIGLTLLNCIINALVIGYKIIIAAKLLLKKQCRKCRKAPKIQADRAINLTLNKSKKEEAHQYPCVPDETHLGIEFKKSVGGLCPASFQEANIFDEEEPSKKLADLKKKQALRGPLSKYPERVVEFENWEEPLSTKNNGQEEVFRRFARRFEEMKIIEWQE